MTYVLVGVDGSDDANRALHYAHRAAAHRGDDLMIVHAVDDAVLAGAWGVVYDPSALQEAGEHVIAAARELVVSEGFPQERIRTEVVMGNPTGVLARMSDGAGLLVVGRRSLSGLERLFVGSTTVGVAATAHCPVIMISAANMPAPGSLRGVIGVGVDATEDARESLSAAFEEASRRGAELQVIHAWAPPSGFFADWSDEDHRAKHGDAARAGVESLVAGLRANYPQVRIDIQVLQGHPVKELTARSEHLDLLFLGVHTIAGFGVGAVVRGLMAHSSCPLALVRRP